MGEVATMVRSGPGIPECLCAGRGGWYYGTDDKGREIVRPCPGCRSRRLTRQFGDDTARTWSTWSPRTKLATAVTKLRAWRGGERWSCLLYPTAKTDNKGSGKTHAAEAVGHEWLARDWPVRYLGMPDFVIALKASFDDDSGNPRPVLPVEFEGLLILDDIGLGKTIPTVQELLDGLAFHRRRHLLPTLMTTNKDLDQLEGEFPRLVDRCKEGVLIEWSAPSWRGR